MFRKYLFSLLAALCLLGTAEAQQQAAWRQKFEAYKAQQKRRYEDFKSKANADFAEFLKRQWADYRACRGEDAPLPVVEPEPAALPADDPVVSELPKADPDEEVRRVVSGEAAPAPVRPVAPPTGRGGRLVVEFFGDRLTLPWPEGMAPRLNSADEHGFSAWWERLSAVDADALLKTLADYAARCRLNGWGCYRLVRAVSEAAYADALASERIAMQAWLLSQLRFKAQVASCDAGLVLLLPFREMVYNRRYLEIAGQRYYIYGYGSPSGGFRTYENTFTYADRQLTLTLEQPMEAGATVERGLERWSRLLGEDFSVPLHRGTIALMYEHPLTDNLVYYRQRLSGGLSERVLSTLRRKTAGMGELQAAEYLLRLVQNGFDYVTDDVAFGRQKQLFIEESFFYGRNNCKDRVGVYSWLVRELLGLDVIYVRYTGSGSQVGHIACAVAFEGEVPGKSYRYRGRRYVVCDPTYINASAGQEMPGYEGAQRECLAL